MRIISKFFDYYDCIQKYGMDKSIIYKRETEEIKEIPIFIKDYYKYRGNVYINSVYRQAEHFAVIIIDKCYFGLVINDYSKSHYFYTEESFKKYLDENNMTLHKYKYGFFTGLNKLPFSCIDIGYDFAIKYRSPIFVYAIGANEKDPSKYSFIKDAFLKKYEFYKAMEPQVIYQKIQQFVSGVLSNPEKEPWPISDKLKAESHGFDKWSFRRKSKKK